jgi:hypothetical protein
VEGKMDFRMHGRDRRLTREEVLAAVRGVTAGRIQVHAVDIEGTDYPVKQPVAAALRMDTLDFTTNEARRVLHGLGFVCRRVR